MPQRSMWQNHQVSGLVTQRQQPRSSGLALGNLARIPTSRRKMGSRRGEGWLYGRSHNSVRKPQGPTVTGSQAAQQGPGEESTQCRKCWRLCIQFPRTVAPPPPELPGWGWGGGQGPWPPFSSDFHQGPKLWPAPLSKGHLVLILGPPTSCDPTAPRCRVAREGWKVSQNTGSHCLPQKHGFRGHSSHTTWPYRGSGVTQKHSRGSFGPALVSPNAKPPRAPSKALPFHPCVQHGQALITPEE